GSCRRTNWANESWRRFTPGRLLRYLGGSENDDSGLVMFVRRPDSARSRLRSIGLCQRFELIWRIVNNLTYRKLLWCCSRCRFRNIMASFALLRSAFRAWLYSAFGANYWRFNRCYFRRFLFVSRCSDLGSTTIIAKACPFREFSLAL